MPDRAQALCSDIQDFIAASIRAVLERPCNQAGAARACKACSSFGGDTVLPLWSGPTKRAEITTLIEEYSATLRTASSVRIQAFR
jgi:hypothetical protein